MRLIDVPKLRKANLRGSSTRMTARLINQMLWVTAACFCGVAVLVVLLGVLIPTTASTPAQPAHSADHDKHAPPALESFESIWAKPLRRALIEGPVTPQAMTPAGPVVAAPGALPITLVGTIGNTLAMLQNPDGSVVVKGVGDQLAGAEVTAIRPGQIDVKYNGQALTLNKPKDTTPYPGIVGNPNNQ
jgi:hypothetical protein